VRPHFDCRERAGRLRRVAGQAVRSLQACARVRAMCGKPGPKRSRVRARIIRARVCVCFMRCCSACFHVRALRAIRLRRVALATATRALIFTTFGWTCVWPHRLQSRRSHASVTHDCESIITSVMCEIQRIHENAMKSQQHRH